MVAAREPQHSPALHPSPWRKNERMNEHYICEINGSGCHVLSVTIEPERPGRPQSEHGPRGASRSHWEEGYTWRRSGPQPEGEMPAQTQYGEAPTSSS